MKNLIILKSCVVDLSKVIGIRKAKEGIKIIIFAMCSGEEILTDVYHYSSDFESEYKKACEQLDALIEHGIKRKFIDINGCLIEVDAINAVVPYIGKIKIYLKNVPGSIIVSCDNVSTVKHYVDMITKIISTSDEIIRL